ncbi:hypothetical protein Mal15_28400 [Stieleria maiorica]|uniref:Uncharacterized protein n=1 Tax=Stieleria maiorica TaxID=2795974 RepID=A0A5B9MGQ6_9BACT|nr:hypothetical protein Mal15_28400 [Stieleria maiorica]
MCQELRFSLVVCFSLFMTGQADLSAQTDPSQNDRLVFHRAGRITSVKPDGTDLTWHTDEFIPSETMDLVYPYPSSCAESAVGFGEGSKNGLVKKCGQRRNRCCTVPAFFDHFIF